MSLRALAAAAVLSLLVGAVASAEWLVALDRLFT